MLWTLAGWNLSDCASQASSQVLKFVFAKLKKSAQQSLSRSVDVVEEMQLNVPLVICVCWVSLLNLRTIRIRVA